MSEIFKWLIILSVIPFFALLFFVRKAFVKNINISAELIKISSTVGFIICVLCILLNIIDVASYITYSSLFKLLFSITTTLNIIAYHFFNKSISKPKYISKSIAIVIFSSILNIALTLLFNLYFIRFISVSAMPVNIVFAIINIILLVFSIIINKAVRSNC